MPYNTFIPHKAPMIKKLLVLLGICCLLTSCSADDNSIMILQDQGYSNVEITGVNIFSCSEDDIFRYNFTAISESQKPVKGVICSAPLKGYTVRFFPNK